MEEAKKLQDSSYWEKEDSVQGDGSAQSHVNKNSVDRLIQLCGSLSIEVSQEQAFILLKYLDLVLQKNKVLNLTAIREWDKGLILHLVDSLTMLEEFDSLEAGFKHKPFLDMGCGAGLPGIPLALMRPDRKGMLCDSVKKKIKAVDEFIDELCLNDQLHTSTERLETLGREERGRYGCVTARAVAPLAVLVEYASPFLCRGGVLIVSKGRPEDDEVNSGLKAAELCGFELSSRRFIELPEEFGQRQIFTFVKESLPKVKLPRSIGVASKQPLA